MCVLRYSNIQHFACENKHETCVKLSMWFQTSLVLLRAAPSVNRYQTDHKQTSVCSKSRNPAGVGELAGVQWKTFSSRFTLWRNVTGPVCRRLQWRLPKSLFVTLPTIRTEAIVNLSRCLLGASREEILPQCAPPRVRFSGLKRAVHRVNNSGSDGSYGTVGGQKQPGLLHTISSSWQHPRSEPPSLRSPSPPSLPPPPPVGLLRMNRPAPGPTDTRVSIHHCTPTLIHTVFSDAVNRLAWLRKMLLNKNCLRRTHLRVRRWYVLLFIFSFFLPIYNLKGGC